MKQSKSASAKELFPGSDIIRKYTFKAMDARDNCALLARVNHMVQILAIAREKSAHFSQKDCFECLPPHEIAA